MLKQVNKIRITSFLTVIAFIVCSYGEFFKTVSGELKIWTSRATTVIRGDLDGNSTIDVFDLIRLRMNTNISSDLADLNGDTIVTNADAMQIQDFALSYSTEFAVSVRDRLNKVNYDLVTSKQPVENSLTQEMADFTRELGTPLAVYNYVYNNINTSFYKNSRKGSIGTFEEKCGNDVDQASLLIAMLRYLGYEATYETYVLDITNQQALDWTGCQSVASARKVIDEGLLSYRFGMPLYLHTIVKLSISGVTYRLDTSLKKYRTVRTAYDELDLSIDSDYYSNFINGELFLETPELSSDMFSELNTARTYYFHKNIIEKKTVDVLPQGLGDKLYLATVGNFNPIDIAFSDCIAFEDQPAIKSAELYGKNITISCEQNGNKYTPIVRKGNEVLFSVESQSLSGWYDFNVWIVTNDYVPDKPFVVTLSAGQICSVVLNYELISANSLTFSYTDYVNTNNATLSNANVLGRKLNDSEIKNVSNILHTYNNTGKMLRYIGLRWFSQSQIFNNRLSEMANVRNDTSLSLGVLSYKPLVTASGISDMGGFVTQIAPRYTTGSRSGNSDMEMSYLLLRGFYEVSLEKSVFKKTLDIDFLSKMDILQEAQVQGIDFVTVTQSNQAWLNFDAVDAGFGKGDIAKMKEYVNNGYTVVVPSQLVCLENYDYDDEYYSDWQGIVYVAINPQIHSIAFHSGGDYVYPNAVDPIMEGGILGGILSWLLTPTFSPLDIPKGVIAAGILIVGGCILLYSQDAADFVIEVGEVAIDIAVTIVESKIEPIMTVSNAVAKALSRTMSAAIASALRSMDNDPKNTYVYLAIVYDKSNRAIPVYVGITRQDPQKRLDQHNRIIHRFDDLELLNRFDYMSRKQARGVEQVIIERNPQFQNLINSISLLNITLYIPAKLFGIAYLETNIVYDKYKIAGLVK